MSLRVAIEEGLIVYRMVDGAPVLELTSAGQLWLMPMLELGHAGNLQADPGFEPAWCCPAMWDTTSNEPADKDTELILQSLLSTYEGGNYALAMSMEGPGPMLYFGLIDASLRKARDMSRQAWDQDKLFAVVEAPKNGWVRDVPPAGGASVDQPALASSPIDERVFLLGGVVLVAGLAWAFR